MHEVVVPALERGAIVLSDRYVYTMVAAVSARGFDFPWLSLACSEFLKPDLAVLLDISGDAASERIRARPDPASASLEPSHLDSMIKAFRQLAEEGCFDVVYSATQLAQTAICEAALASIVPMLVSEHP
jgi:dTMP kinase